MTAPTLAQRVADAFNQHGKFTARVAGNGSAVEVRHVDTGRLAAVVWPPVVPEDEWGWDVAGQTTPRSLRRTAGLEEVIRAVATSVLDERTKS